MGEPTVVFGRGEGMVWPVSQASPLMASLSGDRTGPPRTGRAMGEHDFELDTDDDGWLWATCGCGWSVGPFVDSEDATEAYGDHRAEAAP